ncbi:MAG TPA: hypothetical protein VGG27_06715 [Magnetospirillaceae bacterium]|jgi:hypothetical protein
MGFSRPRSTAVQVARSTASTSIVDQDPTLFELHRKWAEHLDWCAKRIEWTDPICLDQLPEYERARRVTQYASHERQASALSRSIMRAPTHSARDLKIKFDVFLANNGDGLPDIFDGGEHVCVYAAMLKAFNDLVPDLEITEVRRMCTPDELKRWRRAKAA